MRAAHTSVLAAAFPALALAADADFTFGPASDYQKAPAITATPTGNELLITPTDVSDGIPEDGLDFFLGPDLQARVEEALNGVCADETLSQECVDELSGLLNQDHQYALEARVFGADDLLGVVGIAVISGIIAYSQLDKAQPQAQHYHLPSSDVAQAQSISEATAVLATATDDSDHITVTVAPTATVNEGEATITTLSADASGHQSGDVLLALPTEPANLLEQLLRKVGAPSSCASESSDSKKRQTGNGPNWGGITNVATFALPMAAPDQLLRGLGLQALEQVPRLQATIDQASLEAVQAAAAALDEFKDVASRLTMFIAELVLEAAYEVCAENEETLSTFVIEDPESTDDGNDEDDDEDDDDDDDDRCPSDTLESPACKSEDCAGDGGICSNGEYEGCDCLGSVAVDVHPGDEESMDVAYDVFTQMFTSANSSDEPTTHPEPVIFNFGYLTCLERDAISVDRAYFSIEALESAASDFCEAAAANGDVWQTAVSGQKDTGPYIKDSFEGDGDNEVVVSLTYGTATQCPKFDMGKDDFAKTCKDTFGGIIHECDTDNPEGDKQWKQGGYFDKRCVHWYIGRRLIESDGDEGANR